MLLTKGNSVLLLFLHYWNVLASFHCSDPQITGLAYLACYLYFSK